MSSRITFVALLSVLVFAGTSSAQLFNGQRESNNRIEISFRSLDRVEEDNSSIVAQDAVTLGTILSGTEAGDLNMGTGADISYVFTGMMGNQFEIRSAFNNWDEADSVTGNLISPFAAGVNFNTISTAYDSEFFSIEFNQRFDAMQGITFFYGVRYASLEESFSFVGNGVLPPPNIPLPLTVTSDLTTKNPMIGLQVGAEVRRSIVSGIYLDGYFRAGGYANDPTQTNVVDTNFTAAATTSGSNARPSFLGEFAIKLGYDIVPNVVSMTLGYEGMYFDGVALAPLQQGVADGAVFSNTSPFMHGFSVGMRIKTGR